MRSVMENHHCALTFALLEQPENALLATLDKSQRKVLCTPESATMFVVHSARHLQCPSSAQTTRRLRQAVVFRHAGHNMTQLMCLLVSLGLQLLVAVAIP